MTAVSATYLEPIYQSALPSHIIFRDISDGFVGLFDVQGNQIGDLLEDEGEHFDRYHDVYHYAKDQILKYSPTLQTLVNHEMSQLEIDADEASVDVVHNAITMTGKISNEAFEETYNFVYGHHKKAPSIDLFKQAMINAHDIFKEMVEVKEAHPDPIEIIVGYNSDENKIEVQKLNKLRIV